MDLRLYFRVLWRFRLLVAAGLILACLLSFLSYFRVSSTGITYRQSETWQATSVVFLTQKGFPYGYSVDPTTSPTLPAGGAVGTPRFAAPGTFSELALYYAPFVSSDRFQALLSRATPIKGIVQAQADTDQVTRTGLPYIDISAFAASQGDAITLATKAGNVFQSYILEQEVANNVPASQRVIAQVVSRPQQATISTPRKKTTPIVIFLTVLIAAIGLAFVLENLRPRIRPLESQDEATGDRVAVRRSA